MKDGLKIENEAIHSFLMIGQSNMAGRGEFGDLPPIRNRSCFMLRMGRWQQMVEPVNPDRDIFEGLYHSGTSLASTFADEFANTYGLKAGLIPCADGGTSLSQWMPGEILFDHAVMMTRLAMRSSIFSGILWHQGEADCGRDETLYSYKDRFITMITAMRKELNAEKLPLIIGELSENIAEEHKIVDRAKILNTIFREIAKELPYTAVVSSKGLELKPDGIHFNAKSLRIFGDRYFREYQKISCK